MRLLALPAELYPRFSCCRLLIADDLFSIAQISELSTPFFKIFNFFADGEPQPGRGGRAVVRVGDYRWFGMFHASWSVWSR